MHNLAIYGKPIIEIIILWFLIYHILLFFVGTRAVQALKGIVIILLAFLIFQKFDFFVLNKLFRELFGLSVLAILIIFSSEIRQGLASIGKGQVFKSTQKEEDLDFIIHEITQACESLAQNKFGALIAIEKNDLLSAYISTGEVLDSRICANLIEAIFTPNNPLHDGGLIIQKTRIASAGCIFPLTENQQLSRIFGTRHRAALGLSEESDAILIIVSEERRDISIIYRKKFHKDLGGQQLEAKIKELILTK
jgi:diadenylate cyclase